MSAFFSPRKLRIVLANRDWNIPSNTQQYLDAGVELRKSGEIFYIWSFADYVEWVVKFNCNSSYFNTKNLQFHAYLFGALNPFLQYTELGISPLIAFNRERELIDYYYKTFPEDHKFRLGGYQQVKQSMKNLLFTGFPWFYFIPVMGIGRKRKTEGYDITIFSFELNKFKQYFRISFDKVPSFLVKQGKEYLEIPEDAYGVYPKDIKDELLHIQKYRVDRNIIKDVEWLEKDKKYGYINYFNKGI